MMSATMKATLCLLLSVGLSFCVATPFFGGDAPVAAPVFVKEGVDVTGTGREVITNALSESEKADIISRHNTHRGDVSPAASNMVPLQWDSEIADKAQAWAERCTFNHDPSWNRRTDQWSWVGQNIAMGYGYGLLDYVDMWNDEKVDYNYNSNSCNDGAVCGHYTQVVWADSAYIGCGHAACRISGRTYDYLVCNYGPGGNYNGEIPYQTGSPCSNCPAGYRGGCDSDNLCKLG